MSNKPWFEQIKPKALSPSEWASLTVNGTGIQVTQELRRQGAEASDPCAVIIIPIENGQVKGSRWTVSGNLGEVKFETHRVGEDRNKNVFLDLSDLTRFKFPGDDDQRVWGNLSEWEDGLTLVQGSQVGPF